MWKSRLGYILIMAGTLILLYFYSRPFLLYTFLLMILLALGVFLILCYDAKNVKLQAQIRQAMHQGGRALLRLKTSGNYSFLAVGYIMLELDVHNEMFDTTEHRRLLLNLRSNNDFFELPVEADWCGEISIACTEVWIYDIFKLFRRRGKKIDPVRTVIYPKEFSVSIGTTGNFAGITQEEDMVQNRKGNDPSETFDIREYVPGDDVRSIHWKLSSKTDTLILREASDPMHYQVVVMPDFGLEQLDNETAADEINTAIGIGDAVCRQLIRKGISFCMAMPTDYGLQMTEIRGESDYKKMRTRWMSLRVQKKCGNGLRLFRTEHMEHYFSRLLILSSGKYEENLASLDGQISVTLLNVREESKEMRVSRNGTCEIVELPATQKTNTTYRIMC